MRLMVAWLIGGLVGAAVAAPSGYVKQETWQETVRLGKEKAAAERVANPQAGAGKATATPSIKGGTQPVEMKVDVSGWKELHLVVDDDGDYHNDVANWGNARLISENGKEYWLDTMDVLSAKQAFGHFKRDGKNTLGGAIAIGKKKYEHGLGTHAASEIVFKLESDLKFKWFVAEVGLEPARKTATVRFVVSPTTPGGKAGDPDGGIWENVARDFTDEASREQMAWEKADRIWDRPWKDVGELAGRYAKAIKGDLAVKAAELAKVARDGAGLAAVREVYYAARGVEVAQAAVKEFNFDSLRMAIEDLSRTYGEKYPKGAEYLKQLESLQKNPPSETGKLPGYMAQLRGLRQEALLANPLMDFEKLMLVRRGGKQLGLPANWQSNSSLARSGFDNEVMTLSPVRPGGKLSTLYKPAKPVFVGDLKLHFDGDRMLLSSVDENNRWQVFEMKADGTGMRKVTGDQSDIDYYDACYLPDGRIIFTSTAPLVGVPCVNGSSHVTNMYILDEKTKNIRQLTVDQEHNWCPTVLNSGRVMYLRWEYTDTPHSNTRILFHMNPDGTNQMEYYGSNSYWPNGVFYARPVPNHPTKVVGIVTGHHGHPRKGELVIFDPAKNTQEAGGVVQRIPGYGKAVEPVVKDQLANGSWPLFLHPYPLSDKYFLVSAQLDGRSNWGIYLVDVFDNMLLLAELPGQALLEPVPLKKTFTPPVIRDRVDPKRNDAVVYINNIYHGEGMRGMPTGSVKSLRVFAYHFAYHNMGGLLGVLGMNGPWDIRHMLGTVPVESDGSVAFKIPAYTPISVQPLDEKGQAMQVMRSWFTAMPGENLTCAGCHEKQYNSPPVTAKPPIAMTKAPATIEPWHGPTRGFSYPREVQPVIDRYCVGCHDGKTAEAPDLRGTEKLKDFKMVTPGHGGANAGKFSVGYANLHRYVRHYGIESDYHTLMPTEFTADTTHLVQILKKGHYGVKMDASAWDRLITWIDLNTPYHGTWSEELANPGAQRERRRELRKLYTGMDDDPEAVVKADYNPGPFVMPEQVIAKEQAPAAAGWPFDAAEAGKKQSAAGPATTRTVEIAPGVKLEMVLVPAGEYVMGDANGYADEKPRSLVKIEKAYWMGKLEITNAQFAQFDPTHDSHVESKQAYQFGVHGYPCDEPNQPVVRVSWEKAMAFCKWMSARTGQKFNLPTEAQWEWACRAGTGTPLYYGEVSADFSKFANVADAKLSEFASNPYTLDQQMPNRTKYDDYVPKEMGYNDGALVTVEGGKYKPNAWGLFDMHGNAAEWTRTTYKAYPYDATDGRESDSAGGEIRKVVRGGSWRDRPRDCRSANRLSYPAYRGVYNVSFRVICEVEEKVATK